LLKNLSKQTKDLRRIYHTQWTKETRPLSRRDHDLRLPATEVHDLEVAQLRPEAYKPHNRLRQLYKLIQFFTKSPSDD